MDAARLIAVTRRALAEACDAGTVIEECWQAQALVQAVGCLLAVQGAPELRPAARALSDAVGQVRGLAPARGRRSRTPRAAGLSGVRDLTRSLRQLLAILGEVSAALVVITGESEQEAVYWQGIGALDAVDESADRVRALLQQHQARRPDETCGGRAGAGREPRGWPEP